MSAESERVQIRVNQIGPDWVLIHFRGTVPAPEHRFHILHRALNDWLVRHLGYILQHVQVIEHGGEVRALAAFLSAKPIGRSPLSIEIDKDLIEQHGSEYLEAVVADALPSALSHSEAANTIAVVNRRGVTVVIDRSREWAYVISWEKIEDAASSQGRDKVADWLASPTANHLVFALPDGFKPWESPPT